ncbi:MAG: sodium:proton antiporter NhaD [Chitinophagaceae bacterium]|jgi:Na+/H+ antiporter NhaD/arsenite permease-like protein|nr:sodium:proton antiporter NhaD [Chitinophagaceae bacterium]
MQLIMTLVFIVGYAAIVFEHPLRINKTASALLTGVLCWVIYIISTPDSGLVSAQLYDHMGEISGILFFLLGAMTIVELVDAHDGFEAITSRITTSNTRKLMWIICLVAFFLSAVLDNLTTTIVMISLLRKLIADKKTRMYFIGMVVIAANAGGAWTPIGDVTTTMLWIGGQITTANIMVKLFIPSMVCLLVPLTAVSFIFKGSIKPPEAEVDLNINKTNSFERNLILCLGVSALIFVPIFKTITHLPPFMGIMFGVAILWIVTEIIHKNKNDEDKGIYSVVHALRKADVPSVLFFLGILIAISALESTGQLEEVALYMDKHISNLKIIVVSIGLLSALIDNVPLVAATMGMYDLQTFPTDHFFWEFLAYSAGTGGSCLIIGSAAGVVAMGMEKIDFIWYFKNISWLALLGFFSGVVTYLLQQSFLH